MRILFLGAGATGGYFGGRLAKAGGDVTFLVRPKRRDQLIRDGIKIESPVGNLTTPVKAITREEISAPYDAVILSSKAYDLSDAIETIRPAVGENTLVLPLLNGLKHLEALDDAFGAPRVLGGMCQISVTLTDDGTIQHFGPFAAVTLGPRLAEQKTASAKLHDVLAKGFDARYSDDVIAAMWGKWFFIAALASSTCLMRATVGEINRTENGREFLANIVSECVAIATANGYPPEQAMLEFTKSLMSDSNSKISASMLRDIERGGRIEAEQIVGDIVRRGRAQNVATPLLETALIHLQAYENRFTPSEPVSR
ncbi:2-dehydropantoate 2-reductase [Hyphomicrobium sp. 99]|uniref:2-dehydropantoate 2-reductase n=1 Tax=Hyphomicrobium sp. 99 TaxID=1163419 RepID=UPI0005F7D08F|nr:2-dehydropantoate 2-reductase [Hyphomicrobium sp. 99]